MRSFLKESESNCFRTCFGRKGVSEVVAVVFLISLAFLLASLVFVWSRNFFIEQVEINGRPIEEVCKEVAFDVEGRYYPADGNVTLQTVNRGNADIHGFDIKFLKNGESAIVRYSFTTPIGGASEIQTVPVETEVTDLILYPILTGSVTGKKVEKPVSCIYSGKSIRLAGITI